MKADYSAHTPAIHCEGCASSIKRSVGRLAGVETVEVDIESKNVRVVYDSDRLNEAAIGERLTMAGFPPEPR